MDAADRDSPDLDSVRLAYGTWAKAYIERFGTVGDASDHDRAVIAGWARGLRGPVLDAGCGPGHWTAFLRSLGLEVEGVDATPAFVTHAARTHPGIPFRLGDLRALDTPAASLGGVLAWFSLIHLPPADVPRVLARFAAALRPGGGLLVGFFSGAELRPFDHRVVTAWTWPVGAMTAAIEGAGLEPLIASETPQPSGRVFAEVVARRPHPAAS